MWCHEQHDGAGVDIPGFLDFSAVLASLPSGRGHGMRTRTGLVYIDGQELMRMSAHLFLPKDGGPNG